MPKEVFARLTPISELSRRMASGRLDARHLLDVAMERIKDPDGEGERTFIQVCSAQAEAAADCADRMRRAGHAPPLAGIPISVKDLFDVAGQTTRAGSKVLEDAPPADQDCPAVARLRAAGSVLVGRTNMTEFAYSGLGLNPHYGTPLNPLGRAQGLIPGGSSSGAGVSVADGMAAAALGSDTGGSVRIPAAFCGLCGFKPTSGRIPREGVIPLSSSLDSVGPLAPSVDCCARLDAVLSGEPVEEAQAMPLSGLRLGIPTSLVLEDLDQHVSQAFQSALSKLSAAGAAIVEASIPDLGEIPGQYHEGGLLAIEAYDWHRRLLEDSAADYDPRVGKRILAGKDRSAAEYFDLIRIRKDLMRRCDAATSRFDALAMPTVAIAPPTMASLQSDEGYFGTNAKVLRNTSIANFLDRCALTIPCQQPGEQPAGFMLIGERWGDRRLLSIGLSVESALES